MPKRFTINWEEYDGDDWWAIKQWEKYEGDDWWKWAVWLEARDDWLDLVDFVEWVLHPTFRNPIRKINDRKTNFRVETGGWGTFQITAFIKMKDGQQIKLYHYLRLHYPDEENTTR